MSRPPKIGYEATMRHFSELADAPASSRVSPRHKLFEPVTMTIDDNPARAHILNISATGALVHSLTPPSTDAKINLELDGRQHCVSMVWSDGNRFGVRFRTPITGALIRTVLK